MSGRAVIVCHRFTRRGGMERATVELALRLREAGWAITVVCREDELGAEAGGLRVLRLALPGRPFPLMFPLFWLLGGLVVTVIRRGALVHTVGALVPNRADLITVQFVHRAFGLGSSWRRARRRSAGFRANAVAAALLAELAERWAYRRRSGARLVAVSEGVRRELRRAYPALGTGAVVIPNGVDRDTFAPDPVARASVRAELGLADGELLAVFVGGDWPRKGLDHAIAALAAAPRWSLVVVGPGDRAAHEERAEAMGVGDRVCFTGARPDPERYLAAGDCFVLPSAYEAFSLVSLEAAASGLPLLLSAVNGTDELLEDGVDGFLVEREPGSIAAALRRLQDDDLRRALGAAARRATARYGWEANGALYLALYASQRRPERYPT